MSGRLNMNTKERIQNALKQESGLRLTAAEVQGLASALQIGFPAKHRWRRKPSQSKEPLQGEQRYLCRHDLDQMAAIDAASTQDAWSKDDYFQRLAQQVVIARVIERPGRGRRARAIVGCIVYRRYRSWIDIERIVVATDHRLYSYGRQMIATLQGYLSNRHLTHIRTTIDEGNLPLMLFFRSVGFAAVDTYDGVVIMEYYWDGEPRPFRQPGLDAPVDEVAWQSEIYGDGEEPGGTKV
jgi:ribosomal protein S18 acetylase RimI-like enzyme